MSCHWREVKGADLIYAAVWAREYDAAMKLSREGSLYRDGLPPTKEQLVQCAAHAARCAYEAVKAFEDAKDALDWAKDQEAIRMYDLFK